MPDQDRPVSGFLVVDKPEGLTSHDVVARVRKLSKQRKVGHTGTLDPMATGVLLVGVGQATRLIEYLAGSQKRYRATIRFGITTDTLDAEGQILAQADVSDLNATELHRFLPEFRGEIQQVPPIFSALKQGGQPLYKRARAGQAVAVEARLVTIHELNWISWRPPDLTLEVICSAGTYIRALARDLGEAVGTGAHLVGLVRTANGPWRVEEAVPLAVLEAEPDWRKYLHPLDQMVAHLPQAVLDETMVQAVKQGRPVRLDSIEAAGEFIRAYTPTGELLAILKAGQAEENLWHPKKVFSISEVS